MASVTGAPLSDLDEAVLRGFAHGRPAVIAPGLAGRDERAAVRDALRAFDPAIALPAEAPRELPAHLAALPPGALVLLMGAARLATARAVIAHAPRPVTLLWRGYVDRSRDHRIEQLVLPDRLVQRWAVFELPAA